MSLPSRASGRGRENCSIVAEIESVTKMHVGGTSVGDKTGDRS